MVVLWISCIQWVSLLSLRRHWFYPFLIISFIKICHNINPEFTFNLKLETYFRLSILMFKFGFKDKPQRMTQRQCTVTYPTLTTKVWPPILLQLSFILMFGSRILICCGKWGQGEGSGSFHIGKIIKWVSIISYQNSWCMIDEWW